VVEVGVGARVVYCVGWWVWEILVVRGCVVWVTTVSGVLVGRRLGCGVVWFVVGVGVVLSMMRVGGMWWIWCGG